MQNLNHDEVDTLKSVLKGYISTLDAVGTTESVRVNLNRALEKLENYFSLDPKEIRVETTRRGKDSIVTVSHIPTGLTARASGASQLQCKAIALKQLETDVHNFTHTIDRRSA